MVSFDAAAMYGPKFEDFGTWMEVDYDEFSELYEDQPEVWWIKNLRTQWKVRIPALTPQSKIVSKTQITTTILPNEFVVLTQPNYDKVLILFSSKDYFKKYGAKYTRPYYLQKVMFETDFLNQLLSEVNIGNPTFSVLTETRNFGIEQNIKLLNWMDARSLLEYTDISENPLRPFLWYLELNALRGIEGLPENRYTSLSLPYFAPYGITNQFQSNSAKAWEVKGYRKTMQQWVGDEPAVFEAQTSYSSESYKLMMAHTHPKGLCPICNGPIPNQEHKGKYPGALSRFDNDTEVCSICGSAEAMGPMMSEDAREFMQFAINNDDWDAWVTGVRLGREQVEEMMEQAKRASEIMKSKGWEDITEEYMEE